MVIKARDIMIDLETLATTPSALVLTIGAVRFDPLADNSEQTVNDLDSFYVRADPNTFDWPGVDVSDDTLAWWSKQSPEAQAEAFGDHLERFDIRDCLEGLFEFCRPCDRIWANSPSFDITILETIARQLGKQVPWKYYQTRDCRTVYKFFDDFSKSTIDHNALNDCFAQIIRLQRNLKSLNITKLF
jgi:hypothetical protein